MDIRNSAHEIARLIGHHRRGREPALAQCLDHILRPRFLHPTFTSLADERGALLDRVARNSYLHPNGFLKIVLMSEPTFQLRLHVWRPGLTGEPVVENVHSHRWDFASRLLLGGYRFQEFVVDEAGERFHSYRYLGHDGQDSYGLRSTGEAGLRCTFNAFFPSGSGYLLTSDVLHRVVSAPGDTTVSLVLQGPHQPSTVVEVYAEHALKSGDEVELTRLSRDAVAEEIRGVLALVG
ncbi:hypothetical protein [Umezawaea sp.]|uniref:hypothetical protein n=1 Tax=Umezawaea sp. TaxID=1955258 RepID=UPI002ED14829